MRARYCRWHCGGDCLLPATARHARADGFVIATEAAMKLRLIEQGSGCCTVRGGGRRKVRARHYCWHCGGECLPPAHQARDTCRWCCLCNGSRHEAPTDRAELACGCATVRGGGRLKVRARLCRWDSSGDHLSFGPCTCRWCVGCFAMNTSRGSFYTFRIHHHQAITR